MFRHVSAKSFAKCLLSEFSVPKILVEKMLSPVIFERDLRDVYNLLSKAFQRPYRKHNISGYI